jgi:hypothetical protein
MRLRKKISHKEDLQGFTEQIIHEFRIIIERLSNELRQVAEGVATIDRNLDRTCEELKAEIRNETQPILDILVNLNKEPDKYHQEEETESRKIT